MYDDDGSADYASAVRRAAAPTRARKVTESILAQARQTMNWRDATGKVWPLGAMEYGHVRNVRRCLEERASELRKAAVAQQHEACAVMIRAGYASDLVDAALIDTVRLSDLSPRDFVNELPLYGALKTLEAHHEIAIATAQAFAVPHPQMAVVDEAAGFSEVGLPSALAEPWSVWGKRLHRELKRWERAGLIEGDWRGAGVMDEVVVLVLREVRKQIGARAHVKVP